MTADEQALVSKYKTLARAIVANDAQACRLIHNMLQDQGKNLSAEEISALGLRWIMNKNNEPYNLDVADFLKDIGFDFEQLVVLDQENENSGTGLPFRLVVGENHQQLLLGLLNRGIVPLDVCDGMGDNLLVETLMNGQVDFADQLLQAGVDIQNSNLAGQTALHVFAAKVNFTACDWLCRNNIDPTVEDLTTARASEMVPEALQQWDVDALYEALEQYVVDFRNGQPYQSSPEMEAMMAKEKPQDDNDEDDDMTLGEQSDQAKSILAGLNP